MIANATFTAQEECGSEGVLLAVDDFPERLFETVLDLVSTGTTVSEISEQYPGWIRLIATISKRNSFSCACAHGDFRDPIVEERKTLQCREAIVDSLPALFPLGNLIEADTIRHVLRQVFAAEITAKILDAMGYKETSCYAALLAEIRQNNAPRKKETTAALPPKTSAEIPDGPLEDQIARVEKSLMAEVEESKIAARDGAEEERDAEPISPVAFRALMDALDFSNAAAVEAVKQAASLAADLHITAKPRFTSQNANQLFSLLREARQTTPGAEKRPSSTTIENFLKAVRDGTSVGKFIRVLVEQGIDFGVTSAMDSLDPTVAVASVFMRLRGEAHLSSRGHDFFWDLPLGKMVPPVLLSSGATKKLPAWSAFKSHVASVVCDHAKTALCRLSTAYSNKCLENLCQKRYDSLHRVKPVVPDEPKSEEEPDDENDEKLLTIGEDMKKMRSLVSLLGNSAFLEKTCVLCTQMCDVSPCQKPQTSSQSPPAIPQSPATPPPLAIISLPSVFPGPSECPTRSLVSFHPIEEMKSGGAFCDGNCTPSVALVSPAPSSSPEGGKDRLFPLLSCKLETALLAICDNFAQESEEPSKLVYEAYVAWNSKMGYSVEFSRAGTFCKALYRQSNAFCPAKRHDAMHVIGLKLKKTANV